MASYFDDNYGHWNDTDDPDVRQFYRRTQQTNRLKTCADCGRKVRIQPQYDCCSTCADRRERGGY